jgi:hypothetical protein
VLRVRRLLAVASYEMRCHMTGWQALRLLGVAAVLLLPAGAVVTPKLRPLIDPTMRSPKVGSFEPDLFGPPPPPRIRVRGTVPPGLEHRFEVVERSAVEIRSGTPVVVVTPDVSNEMRAALETIDGDKRIEYRDVVRKAKLPGRSLLIAILAISLLTGPLADALPGERARRTLEVLLTAGITRGELIGGKWFAWTVSATLTAAVSAAIACWRGVQEPGLWLLGIPLFIGSTVAFGLWLVRLVDDVVGGSAAPMRVLPAAVGAMGLLARGVAETSPVLAAAVPLGGPLLVAGDLFTLPSQLAAAAAGTVLFVTAVLARTGADLDRMDVGAGPNRWGAAGLSAVAILLWWLTVAGPGVWTAGPSGVTTNLVTPIGRSMLVGGIALLACAVIAIAREARRGVQEIAAAPSPAVGLAVALFVGAALAASGPLPVFEMDIPRPAMDSMLERLRIAAVPGLLSSSPELLFGALVSIVGQAVLFRSVVSTRLGWPVASLLWAIATSPIAPWTALPASLALGAVAGTFGWTAALLAQLMWAAGAGFVAPSGSLESYGCQAIALAIALAAWRLPRREPSRHQS